jgi:hypothetical protein
MQLKIAPNALVAGMVLAIASLSIPASAQHHSIRHREKTENSWRKATYGSAAVGALGLITHNRTLTALGAAGTAYSGYRWQDDLKHRHRMQRNRWYRMHHRRSRRHHG